MEHSVTPSATAGHTTDYADRLSELRRQVAEESAHGRALVADIEDNPVGTVRLDPEIPCVHLTWRGYATDLQIRYVHEVMLVLIRNHGIGKILGDNTLLQAFGDDVCRWIAGDWIPRAVAAGLRVSAVTTPQSVFASEPLRELIMMLSAPFMVRFCADVDTAREWLRGFTSET
jgi:hypothetical protein